MTARVTGVENGRVSVRISGQLTQAELATAQQQVADIIRRSGRVSILVLVENFSGWEQGGAWSDFSFQDDADPQIGRMAIVGDERWRDLALLFTTQGMRPFPIEYFTPDRRAEALAWLGGAAPQKR